jgi:hypothetical protein
MPKVRNVINNVKGNGILNRQGIQGVCVSGSQACAQRRNQILLV